MGLWVSCNQTGTSSEPTLDMTAQQSADMAMQDSPDLQTPSPILSLSQLCGGLGTEQVRQLAQDASGNLIIGCLFSGAVDFGDGTRTSRGGFDVALVKQSPQGKLLWARQFGNAQDDTIERMAVAGNGDIVISGTFKNSIDFGGGLVNSAGGDDYYLAKYGSDGRFLFAKAIGGPNNEYNYDGLAVDGSGNIYFGCGFNAATINVGGGPLTSAGYMDILLAKFDPNGGHLFSKRLGGGNFDYLMSLALDSNGDILIGGQLGGAVDLGGGPMNPGAATTDWGYVARYSSSGSFVWAQGYYTGGPRVSNLVVDGSGNTYAVGPYFDLMQTKTASLTNPGKTYRGFLLSIDRSGKESWARTLVGSSSIDSPLAITIDAQSVYVGGNFNGTVSSPDGPLTSNMDDGYLVAYSQTGTQRFVKRYGGSGTDLVAALSAVSDGLWVGGMFSGMADFEGVQKTAQSSDGFILKRRLQ